MPWVRVSTGISLYFELVGSGPPLLLMDGLGGHWVWFKNVGPLSQRFRVIALDIRGVGNSDKPRGPYRVEQMAQEVLEVIDALAAAPAFILGNSLGGFIAQELALSRPWAVSKLVLMGSSVGGRQALPPAPWVLEPPPPGLPETEQFRLRLPTVLSLQYLLTHPLEVAELVRREAAAPTPPHARLALLLAGAAWRGSYGRTQWLRAPVLVTGGDLDQVSPVANAISLAAQIPGARLVLFPGSDHLCNIEQTEAFDAVVAEFLLAPHR